MKSQSRKAHRGKRRPAQVRVTFERKRLDAARVVFERAGSRAGTRGDDAALAVFTVGLGVLSGHYNERLAERLPDVHLRAFGPDGPNQFREAARVLHAAMTMHELALALLDGGASDWTMVGVRARVQGPLEVGVRFAEATVFGKRGVGQ